MNPGLLDSKLTNLSLRHHTLLLNFFLLFYSVSFWQLLFSILLSLCLNYPSMVGASHILCLFPWPMTLLFIISGNYHMLQASVLLWRHRLLESNPSRFVWHHLPSNDIITKICSGYMSLLLRGDNCCYSLTFLDDAQIQRTYFKKSVSTMHEAVNCFTKKILAYHWMEPGSVETNYFEANTLPLS